MNMFFAKFLKISLIVQISLYILALLLLARGIRSEDYTIAFGSLLGIGLLAKPYIIFSLFNFILCIIYVAEITNKRFQKDNTIVLLAITALLMLLLYRPLLRLTGLSFE